MKWRVAFFAALIGLPALFTVGLTAYFALTKVPRMIALEPRRVTMEYREKAEELKAHPELADYRGRRLKAWRRQSGKLDSMPWGRIEEGESATVWCQVGEGRFLARKVAKVEEVDYAWPLYGGAVFFSLVVLGLSVFCIWNFVSFMRKRDEFLAATAHDLTTPLVSMRYLIGRNDGEAKIVAEKMVRLVENIKEFQRLGARKPRMERVDLLEVFGSSYRLFAEDFRELFGGEDVKTYFADGAAAGTQRRLWVCADEIMCSQIIWNMLGNDLKYAAPFGKVWAKFSERDGLVHLDLVDEGQGMKPKEMKRAFSRYYRASTALKCGKGGFGIGLCTAREFARSMGGDLELHPNRPRGCIYRLTLKSWR
jgi:signal transduction histidine kinase